MEVNKSTEARILRSLYVFRMYNRSDENKSMKPWLWWPWYFVNLASPVIRWDPDISGCVSCVPPHGQGGELNPCSVLGLALALWSLHSKCFWHFKNQLKVVLSLFGLAIHPFRLRLVHKLPAICHPISTFPHLTHIPFFWYQDLYNSYCERLGKIVTLRIDYRIPLLKKTELALENIKMGMFVYEDEGMGDKS